MGFIIIDKIKNNNKKIMIFTEGTILKPKHNNFFSRIAMTKYIPINPKMLVLGYVETSMSYILSIFLDIPDILLVLNLI